MGFLTDRRFAGIALIVLLVVVGLYEVRGVLRAERTQAAPAATKSTLVSPDAKLRALRVPTAFSIDVVAQTSTTTVAGQTMDVPLDASATTSVVGWAADRPEKRPASKVFAVIDGTTWFACSYGIERADVAKALALPALEKSGFRCRIPANTLPAGSHALAVAIVDAAGTGFYSGYSNVTLVVQ